MSNHTSSSSHNDKPEPLTKEEWQTRLESFEFKQADMNKLIMNYLVTGKPTEWHSNCVRITYIDCILLQKVSKRRPKNFKPKLASNHRSH